MRRHKKHVRVGFQTDFQQIATVESKDRPTVRVQIADGAQPLVETRDRIEGREDNDVVNLAGLFALLVNRTDLHRQHKAHFAPTALGQFALHHIAPRRSEPVESIFGRLEFCRQFCEPLRVGVVAGADDIDALKR